MTSTEIRNSFLDFFKARGHTIVPSSPVVPFDDPTLLFANAGMNQFKDVFLGTGKRSYVRVADTQKCIRVSGKHNDLEEVGVDGHHHTFFEMLGNWSFGDYYKKEAIAWAWELLTSVWGLPKERLWATVYRDDSEAEELWKRVTDINPAHVLRFDEKDNFWEMGETGPCGPCSEIHFDRTVDGNAPASLVNAGSPELIEIWNLVFIQYNRDADGVLHPLPAKHVDTGMGFERVCAVLQGKSSNYDTDVFTPLIERISEITGREYTGSTTAVSDIAMRVLADHVRTLTFAIADGAVPSNEGRGYVLRRILRRASRFARKLDVHDPIIFRLVPTLVDTMSYIFPEIRERQSQIERIIKGEEEAFNATLDRGLEIFEEIAQKAKSQNRTMLAGEEAFRLYDTYGFPLDLTQLMAREQGFAIDEETFNKLLEEQRERSREAGRQVETSARIPFRLHDSSLADTEFTGYDRLDEPRAHILAVDGNFVVLDRTPFYAEAGGQVGDTGELRIREHPIRVNDTQRDADVIAHRIEHPTPDLVGLDVSARVDSERRLSIMRNHTATHLVHAALRKVLGSHVHQAGSLVAPTHLRFDFSHFSRVTEAELEAIEEMVNNKIAEGIELVHYRNIPFDEAKKMGALMFFGDKYGDRVNVVEFSEFSREFCGGTHVPSTSDIGYFKFRSEGSIASGVRRIEAVTSDFALELYRIQEQSLVDRIQLASREIEECRRLEAQLAHTAAPEVGLSFERELEALQTAANRSLFRGLGLSHDFAAQVENSRGIESLISRIAERKKSLERELSRSQIKDLSATIEELVKSAVVVDSIRVVSAELSAPSADALKSLGDTLRAKLGSGVGVLAAVIDEKISFVCVVTDDLVSSRRIEAGRVIGAVAKIAGGGGGGRPHMATAGGKDVSKLREALRATLPVVKSMLNI
ncbi:MAG: alanine--tRNA ligase [Ignavibacteria bacterium]|nr:alanine--tRNA ligase [Ignavibacteria bacterium]